ncbi:MAG: outer membrane lipoprotein-sorting protein [Ignavibacteria bacterium]|nr:outer membrane lipoprotein-sorting protein [Ignavibacteria bacterium]
MKKIYTLIFWSLIFSFQFSSLYSQTLTSDEIVNKYINAIGGADELKKIKQFCFTGKAVLMGHVEGSITFYEDSDAKCMFSLISGEGFNVKSYFDMNKGWTMQNDVKEEATPEQMEKLKITVEDGTLFYLGDFQSRGIKTELLGEEKIDKNDCYKIKFTRNGKEKNVQYIDKKTFLAVRIESVSSKGNPIVLNYSDYKEVPGTNYKLPYSFERGPMKGTIDKYELNVPLSAKLIVGEQ